MAEKAANNPNADEITIWRRKSDEERKNGKPIEFLSGEGNDKLSEIRKNLQAPDVKLVLKTNKEILAHKVVLAASSDYFNVMFSGEFKDKDKSEFVVKEVNPHAMKMLINYLYTDKLVLSRKYVKEILRGALLFQFDKYVITRCIDFIERRLNVTNCWDTREFASRIGLKKMATFCFNYALDHYSDIIENETFLTLNIDTILEMIKNKGLCADEKTVYESVIKWVKHDLENRNEHLPYLLEHVRLPIVCPSFFKLVVDREPLLKQNDNCKKYITEAHTLRSFTNIKFEYASSSAIRTQYRSNYFKYVVFIDKSMGRQLAYFFDLFSCEWRDINMSVSYHIQNPSFTFKDGRVLLTDQIADLGLFDDQKLINYMNDFYQYSKIFESFAFNCADVYDMVKKQNTWNPELSDSTQIPHVIQIVDRIYVFTCKKSKYYNIKKGRWFELNSSRKYRTNYGVIEFNGFIYVVGGVIDGNITNLVEKYDPKTDTWSTVSSMIHKRDYTTLCVHNNYLYAIGGKEKCGLEAMNSVERYDRLTDTWEEIDPMNISRAVSGAVSANGLLFVFGGSGSLFSIEVYSPYSKIWTLLNTTLPLCSFACMALPLHMSARNRYFTIDI